MRERGKEVREESWGRQMYRKEEWPDTERGEDRQKSGWVDR